MSFSIIIPYNYDYTITRFDFIIDFMGVHPSLLLQPNSENADTWAYSLSKRSINEKAKGRQFT